jgi:hypothetical protein
MTTAVARWKRNPAIDLATPDDLLGITSMALSQKREHRDVGLSCPVLAM